MPPSTASISPSRPWRGSPSTTARWRATAPAGGRCCARRWPRPGSTGTCISQQHAPAEAQAAAIADDIAYNSHDLDDGLRAGLIGLEDLADVPLAGRFVREALRARVDRGRVIYEVKRRIITALMDDVVRNRAARLAALAEPSLDGVRAAGRPVIAAVGERARRDRGPAALSVRQRLSPPAGNAGRRGRRDASCATCSSATWREPAEMPASWRAAAERGERGRARRRGGRFRRRHDRPLRHQGAPAPV